MRSWLPAAALMVAAGLNPSVRSEELRAVPAADGNSVEIRRAGGDSPVLTQVARPDFRPYLHPIVAPDGTGVVTEYSPGHHPHQTGIYWGFTRLNGRDYFHHPEGEYWRRVGLRILKAESDPADPAVQWETVYELLAEDGSAVLQETQTWTMSDTGGQFILSLEWHGKALQDVTIGRYDYGGLFVRTPWKAGIPGRVINSARQQNERAEGQRSVWAEVSIRPEDREDPVRIAVFDHPQNKGFPQPWRVDGQLGFGPVRARTGDWHIHADESETIRHRLIVSTGELDDVALTKQWSEYTGQGMTWAEWGLAQQEGRSAEFLTPEQAVSTMTVREPFDVNIFAAEPMITQPMAFCWDSRGRMWIAENRDYESRGSGFSGDGGSRILILEDTDHDGTADSRKVFAEGIPFPAGMAVGMGGLWLGAPPNLLFIPDADGDDVADTDNIEVRLTGWGIRDRHETLNSFLWGPDGWLYGCQGFATPSKVGRPKGKGRLYNRNEPFPETFEYDGPAVDINGGVWRYHPTKDRFEVVAHGFSNPWGIDFDRHGQLFITACVIPHLWHVVPGGIYHRQGGSHYNPHVYADIQTIADHRHRSAHGGARVYQSDAFPPEYQNRIFMANIHEHAVLTDVLEPAGSGFIGRHGDDFSLANNAQWIGFGVEIGPDGNVYVLDWHDADICGKDVLNKDTGRVFRYFPKESRAAGFEHRFSDLESLTDEELVALHRVKSAWHYRRARVILQHRATQRPISAEATEALRGMLSSSAGQLSGAPAGADAAADSDDLPDETTLRLRSLWTLHAAGAADAQQLTKLLSDRDPHLRAWAVQLLCEDHSPGSDAEKVFVRMAAEDPSPVVRLYLASAAQRLSSDDSAWQILDALSRHAEDAEDHNLPRMIWFALEPLVTGDPQRALRLAQSSAIPLVARHVARRLAAADSFGPLLSELRKESSNQLSLLLGMRDALEGQFDRESPEGWSETFTILRSQGGERSAVALQLAQQFGDSRAASVMLQTIADKSATSEDRRTALRSLSGRRRPELVPLLAELFGDRDLATEAVRSVAAYDEASLGEELLKMYSESDTSIRAEIIHVMASRPVYGRQLTDAIRIGSVSKQDIPAYVARLLRRVVGNSFVDVWGPLEAGAAEADARFAHYRRLLQEIPQEVDRVTAGKTLFNKTCAACHRLHGYGGNVGPDITGANRGNLEYLLGNILTPSAVIQDAYRMQIVVTQDGRVYSGIPAGEDERTLRLKVANESQPVTIAKSQIESRDTAPISMMPEGLLRNLTDEEVQSLIAYLQSGL